MCRNAPRRILSISIKETDRPLVMMRFSRNAPRRILSISMHLVHMFPARLRIVVMRRGAFCLFQ